ncbi:hypothetical protein SLS56_008840 [Neofusicoccum ribis]|uniref:Uncharacterized protein n=1 Tax=Neofusicoccum ribis TaxID=45134 RepID=A0ABR3SJJ4_9PEZI
MRIAPPDQGNAPEGAQPPPQHNDGLAPSNNGFQDAENSLREEETNAKESEPEDETDHSLRQHTAEQVEEPQQQAFPPTTWASVVRATGSSGPGPVSQAALPKGKFYATTTGTQQSPAQRIAARFSTTKMSKSSTGLSSSVQTPDPGRGSDLLDPTIELAHTTMAPDRNSTAKTVKLKKPPPANTKLGHTPDSPRKRLPAEWTGNPSSPEKGTATLAKRKSTGSLGRPPKTANGAFTSPPKSPTKTLPFELATARRAAVREQKEKTAGTAKVIPAVPKTLPKSKSSMKDTAYEPQIDILRTPSLPAPTVEDFSIQDLSVETVKPHEESESTIILESQNNDNIDDARSEMAKSGEAIKNASAAVEEIQHPLHSHVHFAEDYKAAENFSGLKIEYGSPIRQAKATEEPHEFLPAESKTSAHSNDSQPPSTTLSPQPRPAIHEFEICATRRVLNFSGEEADIESLASLKSSRSGAAQLEGTRSPEILSTWSESSDFTVSRGTDSQLSEENEEAVWQQSHDEPASESLASTEVVVAESTFCEEPSDTFTPDYDSQLPLKSHTGPPSSRGTTARGTNSMQPEHSSRPDPTANFNQGAMVRPGPGVSNAVSRSFQSITTAPSRLNAQAQEFVPSLITSALPGTTFTPGASGHGNAGPHMPRKWAHPGTTNSYVEEQTHAQHIANHSHLNSPRDSAPTGKKKNKKKSPKKFSNEFSSEHWGRDLNMQVNTTGAPQLPSRQFSGAIAASSGSALAGAPGGGWSMPYTFQGSRPYDGSLQEVTNVPYGHRRTANGFIKPVYTGRGGQGMSAAKVPAFEEWFSGGWQSVNGGPLTHASVYEYLREQGEPEYWGPGGSFATIYPPARTPTPAGESQEYVGNGVLKPCGNRVMEGCYEALPHWPFMCPSCQPEHGLDEW